MNSSPGSDRITFLELQKADPQGKILCELFRMIIKYQKIPDVWRECKTANSKVRKFGS